MILMRELSGPRAAVRETSARAPRRTANCEEDVLYPRPGQAPSAAQRTDQSPRSGRGRSTAPYTTPSCSHSVAHDRNLLTLDRRAADTYAAWAHVSVTRLPGAVRGER